MKFSEGTMRAAEYLANRDAIFRPAVNASDNNGTYAPPCLEIGGVQVYAYVRDGILVISLDFDTADISEAGPFAVYDEACVPVVIKAGDRDPVWGDRDPVWGALPEDAISPEDARQLREAGMDEPGDWVLPEWVYGE